MLDTLRKAREEQPGTYLYLLLDPYLRAPPFETERAERESAIVPLRVRDQLPAGKRPLLVQFRDNGLFADEYFLQQTLEMGLAETAVENEFSGQGRMFGGWLLSSEPIQKVAWHLCATMDQRDLKGMRRYLRLADPRVLAALWLSLSPLERSQLLGPIGEWWMFDHLGTWVQLSNGGDRICITDPWRPMPAQWGLIERMQIVNSIVLRARREPSSVQFDPLRIDALVSAGQARGFVEASDLCTFAWMGFRYGERFLEHPRVVKVLTEAVEEARVLEDALADVATDAEWQRMTSDTTSDMEPIDNGALTRHG